MEKLALKLTVLFEDPFWVGLYERECNCKYEVCKITFGAEPKDYEIYDFMLMNWSRLRFGRCIKTETTEEKRVNPKRMQREINKQLLNLGIGTKAQIALKLQHEEAKADNKVRTREQLDAEKRRLFEMKQAKRKEKHRGH